MARKRALTISIPRAFGMAESALRTQTLREKTREEEEAERERLRTEHMARQATLERQFERASAGRQIPQTQPGQIPVPLGGTLEHGPGGETWLRRYSGPADSKIRPLIIEKLSDYTPEDQKNIKQILQDRSRIAQDPELSEAERQAALDLNDAKRSAIPKAPPILREPDPQEKFQAAWVTGPDGRQGYVKPNGEVEFFEKDETRLKRKQTIMDGMNKTYFAEWDEFMDPVALNDAAEAQLRMELGEPADDSPDKRFDPRAAGLWEEKLDEVDSGKKLTPGIMDSLMEEYAEEAVDRGLTIEEGRLEFLKHWQAAFGSNADQYRDILPPISADLKQKLRKATAGVIRQGDPDAKPSEKTHVKMRHPDGGLVWVPKAQEPTAVTEGFTKVQ